MLNASCKFRLICIIKVLKAVVKLHLINHDGVWCWWNQPLDIKSSQNCVICLAVASLLKDKDGSFSTVY